MSDQKLEVSRAILSNILALEDFEEKIYDISLVTNFIKELPEETTINKLIKSKENIRETLIELMNAIDYDLGSKASFTSLNNILNKMVSNVEFDYYKEMLTDVL